MKPVLRNICYESSICFSFILIILNFITVAAGQSTITRKSEESSVTVSSTPTFSQLQAGEGISENSTEFCSCGWPQHLLLPRGTDRGMDFNLFVMLTDYEQDHVSKLISQIPKHLKKYLSIAYTFALILIVG